MMQNLKDMLAESSFCRNLPEDEIEKLVSMSEVLSLPPQSILFDEGEVHPFVYLVLHGKIVLDIYVQGRGHVELLTLSDGEFLGWSPLVSSSPMSVRAKTVTDTVLARFEANQLRELCEKDHSFGYQFMKQMTSAFVKRLAATRIQLLDLFAEPSNGFANVPDSSSESASKPAS